MNSVQRHAGQRLLFNRLRIFHADVTETKPCRLRLGLLALCLLAMIPFALNAQTYISPNITPWQYYTSACDYSQQGPFATEAAAEQWGLDFYAAMFCGSAWVVDPGYWGTPENPTGRACGGNPWAYPEFAHPYFPEIEVRNGRRVEFGFFSPNHFCEAEGRYGFGVYRFRSVSCPQGSVPDNGQCLTGCTCGQNLVNGQCVEMPRVNQKVWQANGDLWVYRYGVGVPCGLDKQPSARARMPGW
jgi:hypothetical protein